MPNRIAEFSTFSLALSLILASWAQADSSPILSKIECSGRATDNSAAQVTLIVDPAATSYPASATAKLRIGTDIPESLTTTLTMTSGMDASGKTVYMFHSALDLNRVFVARTFDVRTGVGALKLSGSLRAPMLQCTFTERGSSESGTPPESPAFDQ